MAKKLIRLSDRALLLLIALREVQSRYSPVERKVVAHRSDLSESDAEEGVAELKKAQLVSTHENDLAIPEELFHTIAFLFETGEPYPLRPPEKLRGVKERLGRFERP
jgi:hypothetical protein